MAPYLNKHVGKGEGAAATANRALWRLCSSSGFLFFHVGVWQTTRVQETYHLPKYPSRRSAALAWQVAGLVARGRWGAWQAERTRGPPDQLEFARDAHRQAHGGRQQHERHHEPGQRAPRGQATRSQGQRGSGSGSVVNSARAFDVHCTGRKLCVFLFVKSRIPSLLRHLFLLLCFGVCCLADYVLSNMHQ